MTSLSREIGDSHRVREAGGGAGCQLRQDRDGLGVGQGARVAAAQVGEPPHAQDRDERANDQEPGCRPECASRATAIDEEARDGRTAAPMSWPVPTQP